MENYAVISIPVALITFAIAGGVYAKRYRHHTDSRRMIGVVVNNVEHLYRSCFTATKRLERIGVVVFSSDTARVKYTLKNMIEHIEWAPYYPIPDINDDSFELDKLDGILIAIAIHEWKKLAGNRYVDIREFETEMNDCAKLRDVHHLIS